MEFGKIRNLENVDWSIPGEGELTKEFLARRKEICSEGLRIFFGAPAWGHPSWVGKIYPLGSKRIEYLYHYSRYFNCIELNTSHYRIPSREQIRSWLSQVSEDFLFCPKIYQGISHARHGLLDRRLLQEWFASIREMGHHLGPCFLQLPPYFDYSMRTELHGFLRDWPDEFALAIELRHPSWFADAEILPSLTRYLQSRGIGLVITDVAGRRDVLHASISADFSLVRFIGNELHPTDFERACAWSERFVRWGQYGLKRLFLFVHEPDDISVPEMTSFFLHQLSQRGGWKFPALPTLNPQLGLRFGDPF